MVKPYLFRDVSHDCFLMFLNALKLLCNFGGGVLQKRLMDKCFYIFRLYSLINIFSFIIPFVDGSQGKNRSGRVNNGVPQVPLKAVSSALDDQHGSLPLHAYREKILRLVKENSVVVVVGETGSGKTTQVKQ